MTFIHSDPEFGDLLRIVAEARQIPVALIEKDYWVTHTLWAIQELGLEVWFKGNTSLSKGFGLIQRFSEDLDLKLEGGKLDLFLHFSRQCRIALSSIAWSCPVSSAMDAGEQNMQNQDHANSRISAQGVALERLNPGGLFLD